jgi:sialidase-1
MKHLLTLILLASLLLTNNVSSQENSLVKHAVIEMGTATTPRSDTASVVELDNGKLIVVYHKYQRGKDAGHDHGLCRIWSKTSSDGGLTWENPRLVVDALPGDLNVQAPALLQLPSGDLLLACLRAHTGSASSTMSVLRSTDNGKTFYEQSQVWTKSKGQWLQGGASALIQLDSGRILLPVHGGTGSQGGQKNTAWCFISDDEGKTWQRSKGEVNLPMRGAMEASVAQLEDGSLRMTLRTQLGAVYMSRSNDEGNTWALAQTTGLSAPESCTCLRRIPGTNNLLLLFNHSDYIPNHHHYGNRSPLNAAISKDGGDTWDVIGNLLDNPDAEYTNLDCTFTKDGNAIITYMFADPAFNRTKIDLRTCIVDQSWFNQ